MIRVLSLGAGVQSSALLLMADAGMFDDRPDVAIFADTGAEPGAVYEWLDWLEQHVTIPIERVQAGNLRDDIMSATRGERRVSNPPVFVDTDGKAGIVIRGCTRDYKVRPIEKRLRELRHGGKVEQWFGISLDEVQRMRDPRLDWMVNRYPLIDLGMSRHDCLLWLERNGHPTPPRSACTFCPYHSDDEWRRLRDNDPDAWAEAVDVDAAIRDGLPTRGQAYLHRSLKPLHLVDLATPEDRGQLNFDDECEGLCGV